MKRLLTTILYTIMMTSAPLYAAKMIKIPKPVVRINNIFKQGTGFLVNSHGLIVTAKHVVTDNDDKGFVATVFILYNGREYKGLVVGIDKDSDVALIQIEAQTPEYYKIEEETNKPYTLYGFPNDDENQVETGISGGYDGDVLVLAGKICHGHSGGPVLDNQTGAVLGLTDYMTSWDDNAECGTVGGAISSKEIDRFLRSLGIIL